MERQENFLKLPVPIKEKINSSETGEKIQQIGQAFNLELLQLGDISRAIRSYYFGELRLEDLPAVLAREIPLDPSKAQELARLIITKIINDKSIEQATQANLLQLTILDALKQVPEVGEQLITSEKIVLKNFPEPVRPSLKNWLADYDYALFNKEHTAMERGIYLFQSANGKRLSSQDRNKLAYLLKAYDEKTSVTINKDQKQIAFQPLANAENPAGQPAAPAPKPQGYSSEMHNNLRFSSPQRMQYEKIHPVKSPLERGAAEPQFNRAGDQPYVVKPVMPPARENIIRTEEKPKPLPKNLVNLKE